MKQQFKESITLEREFAVLTKELSHEFKTPCVSEVSMWFLSFFLMVFVVL